MKEHLSFDACEEEVLGANTDGSICREWGWDIHGAHKCSLLLPKMWQTHKPPLKWAKGGQGT